MTPEPRFPPETETAVVTALVEFLSRSHPEMSVVRGRGRPLSGAGVVLATTNDSGDPLVHISMPDGVRYFSAIVSAASVALRGGDPSTVYACDLVWQTKPLSEDDSGVQVRMLRERDLDALMEKVEDAHRDFEISGPSRTFGR